MTQKPPRYSLVSANGPSVTIGLSPVLSTVVRLRDRHQAAGEHPGAGSSRSFWLNRSTASKTGCISSLGGNSVVVVVVDGQHVLGHVVLLGSGGSGEPL